MSVVVVLFLMLGLDVASSAAFAQHEADLLGTLTSAVAPALETRNGPASRLTLARPSNPDGLDQPPPLRAAPPAPAPEPVPARFAAAPAATNLSLLSGSLRIDADAPGAWRVRTALAVISGQQARVEITSDPGSSAVKVHGGQVQFCTAAGACSAVKAGQSVRVASTGQVQSDTVAVNNLQKPAPKMASTTKTNDATGKTSTEPAQGAPSQTSSTEESGNFAAAAMASPYSRPPPPPQRKACDGPAATRNPTCVSPN